MNQSQQYSPEFIKKLRRTDHLSQYLGNLIEQRKCTELYQLMSSQTNVTYIDQEKKYAVVKTKYLTDIKQHDAKVKKQLDEVQNALRQQINRRAGFNKIIQLKDEQIHKLKQNLKTAYKKIQNLDKHLTNNQQVFTQKQKQLKLLFEKYEQQFKLKNKRKSQSEKHISVSKQQTATQTYYDADINILINNIRNNDFNTDKFNKDKQNKIRMIANDENKIVNKFQQQISQLKQNFEKVIQEISQTAQTKIQQIESQKQIIKQWAQENRRLKKENEQLLKQIKYINQQQQRIRIWKQTLQQFVQNVQKQYQADHTHHELLRTQMQNQNINTENKLTYSNYLKDEKIKYLQAAVDKMQAFQKQKQNKLLQIKQILQDADDGANISQENIVNNLLFLSSRIKQVIKYLLEQI